MYKQFTPIKFGIFLVFFVLGGIVGDQTLPAFNYRFWISGFVFAVIFTIIASKFLNEIADAGY